MRGVYRPGYMAEYRARKVIEREGRGLLAFQSSFVSAVCRKEHPVDSAVMPTRERQIVVGGTTHCPKSHTRGCAARAECRERPRVGE